MNAPRGKAIGRLERSLGLDDAPVALPVRARDPKGLDHDRSSQAALRADEPDPHQARAAMGSFEASPPLPPGAAPDDPRLLAADRSAFRPGLRGHADARRGR